MSKLQLNANAIVSKSKKLPREVKDQILSASEGKVKAMIIRLTDVDGKEVTLKGKLRLSKEGSLVASVNGKIDSFEIETVDAPKERVKLTEEEKEANKEAKKQKEAEELAKDLGL
jgi:hypothetical protein